MYKKLITMSIAGLVLVGCGQNASDEQKYDESVVHKADETTMSEDALPIDQIVELLNTVPPPLELAVLMKQVGGEYSSGPMNPTDNVKLYNTSFKKAINLGVYGADLGYANIYNQNQDAISYLTTVKDLADELSVGQFFDFETIKKLAESGDNLTELLNLTTKNYEKMNNHLKKKKRVNESVLMMTGGWIEGLHVACYVAKNHDSQVLNERIGEQKITLEQIMLLLDMFKNDKDFANLQKDMGELNTAFQKVKIEEVQGETVTKEVDGLEITEIETTTQINISKEVLEEISATTEKIRAKFVK